MAFTCELRGHGLITRATGASVEALPPPYDSLPQRHFPRLKRTQIAFDN